MIRRTYKPTPHAVVIRTDRTTSEEKYLLSRDGDWTFNWYATLFPLAEAKELANEYGGRVGEVTMR